MSSFQAYFAGREFTVNQYLLALTFKASFNIHFFIPSSTWLRNYYDFEMTSIQ